MSLTDDPSEPWIVSNNWAVVKGKKFERGEFAQEYFLIWIAEDPPDSNFIRAAKAISKRQKQLSLPGYSIQFHESPSPGFVLKTRHHWNFQSPQQASVALDRVIWEVNRLTQA